MSIVLPRSEGVTMARARTDVDAELREVYDAHYGRLAGWTNRLVGDPDLAHDLATEAFVKLVRDHWRKRGREHSAYLRHEGGAPAEGRDDPDVATQVSVRTAVQSLPDRLRVAVLLYYFADLSVGSVATQLGKSEGAVKRDLFEARKSLAAMLEGAR